MASAEVSYRYWTIEVKNHIELRLIVDGRDVAEEFQGTEMGGKCNEKRITGIAPLMNNSECLQIHLGNFRMQLLKEKFKTATLFGVEIRSSDRLLTFWQEICDFLEYGESKKKSNLTTDESNEETKEGVDFDIDDTRDHKETNLPNVQDDRNLTESTLSVTLSNDDDSDENTHENEERMTRNQLLTAIAKKKAAYKYLDIFTLHDPPMKYRVRKTNQDFIDKLADTMVKKKSVSLHNAPNIIGLIEISIEEYNEEDFEKYTVYIIDGNHSIKAQREAYRRTQDSLFKFRSVNIYCGLSENEALLLGISRNEDTGKFVKFADHQKVEVLRRRLYAMTYTPETMEPPKPPKEFKEVFASFLNLQTKKAIDSKSILRFLATCLSKRNYRLYKEINNRGIFPASKFEGIKGLQEEDAFNCLKMLSSTDLQKGDWQSFSSLCQQKQKNPKKLRKDVTITFNFHEKTTQASVGNKQINGNLACYRFIQGDTEVVLSNAELGDLIFAFHRSRTSHGEEHIMTPFKRRNVCKKVLPDMPIKTLSPTKLRPNIIKRHLIDIEESDTDTDDTCSFVPIKTLSPTKLRPNIIKRHLIDIEESDTDTDDTCSFGNSSNTQDTSKFAGHSLSAGQSCSTANAIIQEQNIDISLSAGVSCSTANAITPVQSVDISLSVGVSSFLYKMADFDAARRAESRINLIEEDEVETMPDRLLDGVPVLLDLKVQKEAKEYFSPDAWECVESTLKVLEGRYLHKTQQKEYMDPSICVGKGKNLIGQTKGQIFMRKRPDIKEKIKTCSRGIYSFSSEDLSPIKFAKGKPNMQKDDQPQIQEENKAKGNIQEEKSKNLKRLNTDTKDTTTAGISTRTQSKNKSRISDKYVSDDVSPPLKCKIRLTDISTVKNWKEYDAKKK